APGTNRRGRGDYTGRVRARAAKGGVVDRQRAACWRRRAGIVEDVPADVPEPWAAELAGACKCRPRPGGPSATGSVRYPLGSPSSLKNVSGGSVRDVDPDLVRRAAFLAHRDLTSATLALPGQLGVVRWLEVVEGDRVAGCLQLLLPLVVGFLDAAVEVAVDD